jgi:hypothetical protein
MLNLFFYGIDEENKRYLRNKVPFDPGTPPDAPPPLPPSDIIPPKLEVLKIKLLMNLRRFN